MKYYLLLAAALFTVSVQAQKNASIPFEKWISLKQPGFTLLSPNGKYIVFSVSSTDWSANNYDTELWLSKEGQTPVQLTRTPRGSSVGAAFTPDNNFVSFLADRGDKMQLYIISIHGGEALQVTKDEDGIGSYEWSPDGKQIAYTKAEPDSKKEKSIKDRYGAFAIEGEEYKLSHLWLLNFNYDSVVLAGQYPCYTSKDSTRKNPECYKLHAAIKLTEGNFTVSGFSWKPDGKSIAFNRQPNPLINSSQHSDISILHIANRKTEVLVANPSNDAFAEWSPDGTAFLYRSSVDDSLTNFFRSARLFLYDMTNQKSREIGADIDENKGILGWTEKGIYLSTSDKMRSRVFHLDLQTGNTRQIRIPLDNIGTIQFAKKSDQVAVNGRNFDHLPEIYTGTLEGTWKKVSDYSAQISTWNTPVNEIIEWKSKDGTVIEGVLLKPRNYEPARKYPLLVVIHGGPAGIDRPEPTPTSVYPVMQWTEKGALVLRVNYRGSAGYGEKFRSLNVRNLGVGDMWDVVSGIEFLNQKGLIDTARMGCMGWSQGGYISAFLTTNTTLFKAISVGAGISDWVTYYVNTDITPFTRQYLKATPWQDMDIYLKTSPMTNINKARTPTLIQHGEFDRRVPIPNAYQLYRGLQDRNIPSRLIVYKGFGHGITKPKERLAAIWHNWQWFNHYIFGEREEALPVD
jgi:dipeptidyl aminopeptidase/acylaminoacyl peptidase